MAELVTIAEAARRLGFSRQRLSAYVRDEKLEKATSDDGRQLIDFALVQSTVQALAAKGKLRVRASAGAAKNQAKKGPQIEAESSSNERLIALMLEHLTAENKALLEERRERERLHASDLAEIRAQLAALKAENEALAKLKRLPPARLSSEDRAEPAKPRQRQGAKTKPAIEKPTLRSLAQGFLFGDGKRPKGKARD